MGRDVNIRGCPIHDPVASCITKPLSYASDLKKKHNLHKLWLRLGEECEVFYNFICIRVMCVHWYFRLWIYNLLLRRFDVLLFN